MVWHLRSNYRELRYSTGGLVTLDADGTAKHDLVVVFNAVGTWECLNPARREIRITWNTGFTMC